MDSQPSLPVDAQALVRTLARITRYQNAKPEAEIKSSVHELKLALRDYCISGFVAHDDIVPSLPWQDEIERALRSMHASTALITPEFIASRWCDQEIGDALGAGKPVVPIRLGADPHGFIVGRLEDAGSWTAAKTAIGLLERISKLSASLTERIQRASAENPEVSDAYGVPGRIDKLCARHRAAA